MSNPYDLYLQQGYIQGRSSSTCRISCVVRAYAVIG